MAYKEIMIKAIKAMKDEICDIQESLEKIRSNAREAIKAGDQKEFMYYKNREVYFERKIGSITRKISAVEAAIEDDP